MCPRAIGSAVGHRCLAHVPALLMLLPLPLLLQGRIESVVSRLRCRMESCSSYTNESVPLLGFSSRYTLQVSLVSILAGTDLRAVQFHTRLLRVLACHWTVSLHWNNSTLPRCRNSSYCIFNLQSLLYPAWLDCSKSKAPHSTLLHSQWPTSNTSRRCRPFGRGRDSSSRLLGKARRTTLSSTRTA